jgi:hypothetical protein
VLWGPSQTDAPWPQPPFWPEDYPILLELVRVRGHRVALTVPGREDALRGLCAWRDR